MAAKDSPLKQFEIDPISNIELGGYNISFTNSSFAMLITVLVITLFLTLTVNTRSIIPSRMQLISELMYNFIAQLLSDTVQHLIKCYIYPSFPEILGMIKTFYKFASQKPPDSLHLNRLIY